MHPANEIQEKTPNLTKRKPKKLKRANGRRRPASTMRNHSSESSLMVDSNMESTIALGKPHSMLALSGAHDRCQPMETHVSLKQQVANIRSRKASAPRARKSNIASILSQSPIPMKPRSEPALNAAKHARRITKPQSLSSVLGSLPPTPHAKAKANGNAATFLSDAIEGKSLTGLTSRKAKPLRRPSRGVRASSCIGGRTT
jgi:hypothetical protein